MSPSPEESVDSAPEFEEQLEEEELPDSALHRRTWPWILALILVGLGIGYLLRPSAPAPEIPQEAPSTALLTVLSDPVYFQEADAWSLIVVSRELHAGDRIRTGPGGAAEIGFADASIVRLNAETEIALPALPTEETPGGSIELLGGEVWNRLVNLKGQSYSVSTDSAVAMVRGSAFSIRTSDTRFAAYAVQHELLVKLPKIARQGILPEGSQLGIDPSDPALLGAPLLPIAPQDAAFLDSEWRRTNLERDIAYLGRLEQMGKHVEEARAARMHAECLLDATKCENAPTVTAVRASVADGVAVATIDLAAWDGRLLHTRWKRGTSVVAEHDLPSKAGDILVRDELPVADPGTYVLDVLVDNVTVLSASFTVDAASETPSSAPDSACPRYTSTATCGTNQFLIDRDGDCVYDACQSCTREEVPTDANGDGLKDACKYTVVPPRTPPSVLQPASSTPSSVQCVDPGQCPYGFAYDAHYCRVCAPAPVCGNGTVESGEQCEPPNTRTCDAKCQTVQAVAGPVCGNQKVETGEQCDPPDGKTCDAQCQTIVAPPPVLQLDPTIVQDPPLRIEPTILR